MESCDCPHPAAVHAPVQDVGSSMCLVVDCECDGTREQVAAMKRERAAEQNETLNALVDTLRSVLSNKLPRTVEDMARNAAAAIVANFKIEAR